MKKILIILIIASAALAIFGCTQPKTLPTVGDYHIHADFKVILDGTTFDFNKAQYMSTDTNELSPVVHLHDFNPYVIHFHSSSATLGDFFKSLGMDFNQNCFFDGSKNYCTGAGETLQFYVNGIPNGSFGAYKPNDLDKLLIFYGSTTPTTEDFNSITSWACIYSKKCAPPPGVVVQQESCTGTGVCTFPGK